MSTHTELGLTGRRIIVETLAGIDWDTPQYAWEMNYEGHTVGMCSLGSMTLFAGRPGAGKSTSSRDIAAKATRGELQGCYHGTPVNVGYIAGEENLKYNVVPGLIAAGADMNRVYRPRVQFIGESGIEEEVSILPEKDMAEITGYFNMHEVKIVIVDPIMSFMDGIDVNKNNEVRKKLKPWLQLAEDIDGVVIAVTHLNKSGNGDVVAGINGSSAFGEVARCVVGFTKKPDQDDRVMSVEKNSTGSEGAAWTYQIIGKEITNSKGVTKEFAAFQITGESDQTVGEVLRDAGDGGVAADLKTIVLDFLKENNGVAYAKDVEAEVKASGHAWKTAQNNKLKWKISSRRVGANQWVWELPESEQARSLTNANSPYTREDGITGSSKLTAQKRDPATSVDPEIPRSHESKESEFFQHPQTTLAPDPGNDFVVSDEHRNSILAFLQEDYGFNAHTIAGSLPYSEEQVLAILQDLETHNLVFEKKGKYQKVVKAA